MSIARSWEDWRGGLGGVSACYAQMENRRYYCSARVYGLEVELWRGLLGYCGVSCGDGVGGDGGGGVGGFCAGSHGDLVSGLAVVVMAYKTKMRGNDGVRRVLGIIYRLSKRVISC
jgi:hypothetical protein